MVLHLVRGSALGQHLASAFGLLDPVKRPLVSIVTHGELLVIAGRNGWGGKKRSALRKALDNLVTIDLNGRSVLAAYVEVRRYSRRAPGGSRELNANHAWIVAPAKAADAMLITTDGGLAHLKAPDW